jgi:ribonuclease HI
MKKLKFDHGLAEQVLGGERHSTWRMYDDKDLTVNDQVVIVDKVTTDKPQTWRVIGIGRINRIIEKRLGDITDSDYDPAETPEPAEQRLRTFRATYGDSVTWDTPVKIVSFDFTPGSSDGLAAGERPNAELIGEKVVLYSDGGSRGNPGPSASGYVLIDEAGEVLVDKAIYLGITTNNQAEYHGLKAGLEEAQKMGAREVDVRLDSQLVVNQMKGVYKVSNRDLWPIHESIKYLVAGFRKVTFTHVPRELNKQADAAVNRVLDEQASRKMAS